MNNILENKNGLYDLLGIPSTHVMPSCGDDIILIHVDPANTPEQILAYTKQVKEALPNNKILVLPSNISITYFKNEWWTNEGAMIGQQLKEKV